MGLKTEREHHFIQDVGARLKKIRKVKGISYSEMLANADLPYGSSLLANWESGRTAIPVYRLALIAKALKVSVGFLLEEVEL